ncbi:uncharacterized protein ABDE67_005517 [Symphorus nematophorus]
MKVQLAIPLCIAVTVALMGLMKIRKKEQDKEDKRQKFEDIKLRVTHDVLGEYEAEKAETEKLLEKTKSDIKLLSDEVSTVQARKEKAKGDADACQGGEKSAKDELAKEETEFNNLKAQTDQEKTSWATEVETLKKQLEARSAMCDHLKKDSEEGSKLCKQEEPKAEAPKQEEPKAEEPKAEAPKQEEPKAEEPKAEEPKAEAPKQEEPKAEEPKAEAPKQEEPKAEAPK